MDEDIDKGNDTNFGSLSHGLRERAVKCKVGGKPCVGSNNEAKV